MSVRTPGKGYSEGHRSHDRQPAGVGTLNRDKHLLQVEEGFEYQKVHACGREQTNLLGNEVANVTLRGRPLAFKQLRPRDRTGDQSLLSRHLASNAHGGGIDGSICSPYPARLSFSRVPKKVSACRTCEPALRNSRCSSRSASGCSIATSGVNCPLPLPVPTFSRPRAACQTQPRRSSLMRYPPSPSTIPCLAIRSRMFSVCLIGVIPLFFVWSEQ